MLEGDKKAHNLTALNIQANFQCALQLLFSFKPRGCLSSWAQLTVSSLDQSILAASYSSVQWKFEVCSTFISKQWLLPYKMHLMWLHRKWRKHFGDNETMKNCRSFRKMYLIILGYQREPVMKISSRWYYSALGAKSFVCGNEQHVDAIMKIDRWNGLHTYFVL